MAVFGPDDDDDDSPKSNVRNMFSAAQKAAEDGSEPVEGPKRVVTMFANGFTVDDGPFRSLDDEDNQSFIRDVGRGVIPRELEQQAAGGAFNLELVDKRSETYMPPAYTAFGGGGNTLSSGAASPQGAVLGSGADVVAAPVVDETQPKTVLQIRLANGKKLRATLNLTHTVRHVEAIVQAEGGGGAPYVLLAGYPPTMLSDPSASIEAAGLKGASIQQKLA
ncbi:SEP domain-containing protein [Pelagophyceae sp. CCMP2097]|nr:SEP domain-containing protein [Pelagophyceae sp. CCMP2097]